MKVILINQSDVSGGAAIAGYRLHQGLLSKNIDVNLLVDSAKIDQTEIHLIERRRFIEELFERLSYRIGLNYISISNTFSITNSTLYQLADILNFHNLHGGYFNYLAIPKLTRDKPTVFTLHDMWSFTGHCAYSFECDRWKSGCGQCPHLDTYPKVSRDNTAIEWKLKSWVYDNSSLTIITPSKWLAQQAKQSLLRQFAIHHIPNGLDLSAYQPLDPEMSRIALGLPLGKKVLFFSAQSLKDGRKGGDLLIESLRKLPMSLASNIVLMTMGEGSEVLKGSINIPIFPLGYVSSDRLKSLAYSAADVFIFPTRADNLPIVVQESLACGTPIISFNVGGVPEVVRPEVTGLLAKPEDSADLTAKIIELLEDNSLRHRMQQCCREVAVAEYSIETQAERYITLYRQVIDAFHQQ